MFNGWLVIVCDTISVSCDCISASIAATSPPCPRPPSQESVGSKEPSKCTCAALRVDDPRHLLSELERGGGQRAAAGDLKWPPVATNSTIACIGPPIICAWIQKQRLFTIHLFRYRQIPAACGRHPLTRRMLRLCRCISPSWPDLATPVRLVGFMSTNPAAH